MARLETGICDRPTREELIQIFREIVNSLESGLITWKNMWVSVDMVDIGSTQLLTRATLDGEFIQSDEVEHQAVLEQRKQRWEDTQAIQSITIPIPHPENFKPGSTFSLTCYPQQGQTVIPADEAIKMKAADITDEQFIAAMPPREWPYTVSRHEMAEAFPDIPPKVIAAKARQLIKKGKIAGCPCGKCRGDYSVDTRHFVK
jgi:hypothetical protein